MKQNLAARAARWSAGHWKTATFGWLAFVIVAVVAGGAVGTKHLGQNDALPGESGRVTHILDESFKQPAAETVLIQSRHATTASPAFRSAVNDVVRRVSAVPVVTNVQSPLARGNSDQVSSDRRSAIVKFDIRGDADDATNKIDPVVAAVDRAKAAHPQLFIGGFGEASTDKQISDKFTKDLWS